MRVGKDTGDAAAQPTTPISGGTAGMPENPVEDDAMAQPSWPLPAGDPSPRTTLATEPGLPWRQDGPPWTPPGASTGHGRANLIGIGAVAVAALAFSVVGIIAINRHHPAAAAQSPAPPSAGSAVQYPIDPAEPPPWKIIPPATLDGWTLQSSAPAPQQPPDPWAVTIASYSDGADRPGLIVTASPLGQTKPTMELDDSYTGARSFPPGGLGGSMTCATSAALVRTSCVWSDEGTMGQVDMSGIVALPNLAAITLDFRNSAERPR